MKAATMSAAIGSARSKPVRRITAPATRRERERDEVGEDVLERPLDVHRLAIRLGQLLRHHAGDHDARERDDEDHEPIGLGRVDQPADAAVDDQAREHEQRRSVRLRRQHLHALEPEREVAARGAADEPQHDQREQQRARVAQHVRRVGEQRQGVGEDAGDHLGDHERDDQREPDREPTRVGVRPDRVRVTGVPVGAVVVRAHRGERTPGGCCGPCRGAAIGASRGRLLVRSHMSASAVLGWAVSAPDPHPGRGRVPPPSASTLARPAVSFVTALRQECDSSSTAVRHRLDAAPAPGSGGTWRRPAASRPCGAARGPTMRRDPRRPQRSRPPAVARRGAPAHRARSRRRGRLPRRALRAVRAVADGVGRAEPPAAPYDLPLDPPVPHEHAARVADELVTTLEHMDVPIARRIGDLRPDRVTAIMHLEGAEPLVPDLSNLEQWYERGAALARDRLVAAERLRRGRAVPLPRLARHRPRPHRRRQGARGAPATGSGS